MKAKNIIPMIAFAVSSASFAQGTGIGIKLENMNQEVKPGTDFYQYACGGWMKNNPLGPEYARFGSFNTVSEENNKRIREIIEGLAAQKQAEKEAKKAEKKLEKLMNAEHYCQKTQQTEQSQFQS